MSKEIKKIVATRANLTGLKNLISGQLPNPDYVLNKIGNRIEALNELRYDSHVASCIQSRKSGVLSHEWEVKADNNSSIINLITKIFKNFDIPKIISDMLEAPLFGYKLLEIIWREENGFIIPVDIIGKPPEWFFFDENNICKFRKGSSNDGEILTPRKFFLIQHNPTYINPYGESILSKCYWPVFFKKEIMKNWVTFSEKYGMPFLWANVPLGTDDTEKQELLERLDDLRQDGIIVTEGDETKVSLLDASKSSSPDLYATHINMLNSEISKAILSQTLTTELQSTGSFAASQTHYQVRQDIVDADKRIIESCFNDLIKWITELNLIESNDIPKFVLFQEENVDLTLAERDGKLVPVLTQSGYKLSQKYLEREYGFKEGDLEIVEIQPPPTFAEGDSKDDGLVKLSKAVEPVVKQVLSLVNNGNSYQEIQDLIIKQYPKLNSDEIEANIAQAIMLSNAAGQFKAGK